MRAGDELTGWIMDQDKTLHHEGDERRADRPQDRDPRSEATATPSSSTASTSAARSRRSRWASICTCTTSRPSAGEANAKRHFRAIAAKTAASACATTSSSCRSTICRTRLRSRRAQHQGRDGDPASVRPAAVRRRPRPALPHADRHRQQSERRCGRRDRHRGQWTKKIVDGIAATGKPVIGFGIELHGDHDTIMRASKAAREYVQWASELQREECPIDRPVGLDQVRRVGHDFGLRRQPDGRQRVRQALSARHHAGLRRDHRTHRRRAHRRRALPRRRKCARSSCSSSTATRQVIDRHKTSDLSDSQPTKGNIAGGLTTIEEKALGNIQKIGKQVHGRRRARQGRDADRARPVVHGFVVRRRGDGDAVRRVGLRRAFLPDRARAT